MNFTDYLTFVYNSKFIISDSGTGQEEPAFLNTKVIVPKYIKIIDNITKYIKIYELLLNFNDKEILVINQVDDDKTDLIQDLVSIIYSFSARMYGLRKKKNKQQIINFLEILAIEL